MTDRIQNVLADYALDEGLPVDEATATETKRRLLDALGVAVGSRGALAVHAVGRYADGLSAVGDCTIWGGDARLSAQAATMVNGTAVRCLDFNDTYHGQDGIHPSDVIPALVAVAEQAESTGIDLLTAIAISYELACRLSDALALRRRGWDHVNLTALATCGGVARLLGLSASQLREALSIAAVSHAALSRARSGQLSMWKGIAAADATKNAIDACLLARSGVRGPSDPFEGPLGVVDVLSASGVDWGALEPLAAKAPPTRIHRTHIKLWPAGQLAQAAIQAALEVREALDPTDQIVQVTVTTFQFAVDIMGDPDKIEPLTRETADHSLPYVTAAALSDGRIDFASFDVGHRPDGPRLRQIMDCTVIVVSEAYTASFPGTAPSSVEVTLSDGRRISAEVLRPRGHASNPCSQDELEGKFRDLTVATLGARADQVIELVDQLEVLPRARSLTGLLRVDD